MNRGWGGDARAGDLVEYKAEHRDRMGHCDWLPEPGDLCVVGTLSGDCFYKYTAFRDGVQVGTFGAYQFGEPSTEYRVKMVIEKVDS